MSSFHVSFLYYAAGYSIISIRFQAVVAQSTAA